MIRIRPLISLVIALVACSPKARAPKQAPGLVSTPLAMAAPAPIAKGPAALPPDPREVTLSAALIELLEQKHLLHRKIDDRISTEAFATYVDRLDRESIRESKPISPGAFLARRRRSRAIPPSWRRFQPSFSPRAARFCLKPAPSDAAPPTWHAGADVAVSLTSRSVRRPRRHRHQPRQPL